MTDCVYHAYAEHLRWLGSQATSADFLYWKALKWWTHGSKRQYTLGGVVPWMLDALARSHGLRLRMEYRVYTPEHHLAVARTEYSERYDRLASIIERTDFGTYVHQITMAPAIYLLLMGQHAVFSNQVPNSGMPVTAIQIHEKET